MQKSAKSAHKVRVGLCSTCSNDPLCTFPRRPGAAIMECLEFEGEMMETDARPANSCPPETESATRLREPGLCSLCENRPTCVFPKPVGGVWFCEEFQ
jgi:hypothetical protein